VERSIDIIDEIINEHLLVAELLNVIEQTASALSAFAFPIQTGRVNEISKENGGRDVAQ